MRRTNSDKGQKEESAHETEMLLDFIIDCGKSYVPLRISRNSEDYS
jgi:hypothetical protein